MGVCSGENPEPWPDKWILHHDYPPAYGALRFREFLAEWTMHRIRLS
jgi:hypothetical protein